MKIIADVHDPRLLERAIAIFAHVLRLVGVNGKGTKLANLSTHLPLRSDAVMRCYSIPRKAPVSIIFQTE